MDIPSPSRVYARLGAVYAWASPDYIRDHMTEPQLFSYRAELSFTQEQMARPLVHQLLEAVTGMLDPKNRAAK